MLAFWMLAFGKPSPFGAEVARTEKEADPDRVTFVEDLAAAEGGTGLCHPFRSDVRGNFRQSGECHDTP